MNPWFEDLYGAVANGQEQRSLDLIYEKFDELLMTSDFSVVDTYLSELDPDRLDAVTMLAVCSSTSAAREKLSSRAQFAVRVETRVRELESEREVSLLNGLT